MGAHGQVVGSEPAGQAAAPPAQDAIWQRLSWSEPQHPFHPQESLPESRSPRQAGNALLMPDPPATHTSRLNIPPDGHPPSSEKAPASACLHQDKAGDQSTPRNLQMPLSPQPFSQAGFQGLQQRPGTPASGDPIDAPGGSEMQSRQPTPRGQSSARQSSHEPQKLDENMARIDSHEANAASVEAGREGQEACREAAVIISDSQPSPVGTPRPLVNPGRSLAKVTPPGGSPCPVAVGPELDPGRSLDMDTPARGSPGVVTVDLEVDDNDEDGHVDVIISDSPSASTPASQMHLASLSLQGSHRNTLATPSAPHDAPPRFQQDEMAHAPIGNAPTTSDIPDPRGLSSPQQDPQTTLHDDMAQAAIGKAIIDGGIPDPGGLSSPQQGLHKISQACQDHAGGGPACEHDQHPPAESDTIPRVGGKGSSAHVRGLQGGEQDQTPRGSPTQTAGLDPSVHERHGRVGCVGRTISDSPSLPTPPGSSHPETIGDLAQTSLMPIGQRQLNNAHAQTALHQAAGVERPLQNLQSGWVEGSETTLLVGQVEAAGVAWQETTPQPEMGLPDGIGLPEMGRSLPAPRSCQMTSQAGHSLRGFQRGTAVALQPQLAGADQSHDVDGEPQDEGQVPDGLEPAARLVAEDAAPAPGVSRTGDGESAAAAPAADKEEEEAAPAPHASEYQTAPGHAEQQRLQACVPSGFSAKGAAVDASPAPLAGQQVHHGTHAEGMAAEGAAPALQLNEPNAAGHTVVQDAMPALHTSQPERAFTVNDPTPASSTQHQDEDIRAAAGTDEGLPSNQEPTPMGHDEGSPSSQGIEGRKIPDVPLAAGTDQGTRRSNGEPTQMSHGEGTSPISQGIDGANVGGYVPAATGTDEGMRKDDGQAVEMSHGGVISPGTDDGQAVGMSHGGVISPGNDDGHAVEMSHRRAISSGAGQNGVGGEIFSQLPLRAAPVGREGSGRVDNAAAWAAVQQAQQKTDPRRTRGTWWRAKQPPPTLVLALQ